jgi:uncharacterized protein (DUF433 family)
MSVVPNQIVSVPGIHAGEPVIEGTSTPVRAIAELWNQGMPAEEVPLHLPHLELAQVFEALRYYLTHRAEIESFIEANRISDEICGKRFNCETGKIG